MPGSVPGVGVVVVTYSPGHHPGRVPGHAGEGDHPTRSAWCSPTTGRPTARPERAAERPGRRAAAHRGQPRLRPGRQPRRAAARRGTGWWSPTRTCAGSRARWTRCWRRSSGGRGPACSARRSCPPDGTLYPSARAAALARPRHRARAVRLVVAVQPVDRGVPAGARGADGAAGRLAVRVLHAGAAGGVRRGRRLRPGVLHVLRGPRPVRADRPGRLAERVRADRGGHPRGRARRPSKDPRTMADAHHASAWRYLSRRYAGAALAAGPAGAAGRAGRPGRARPPGARRSPPGPSRARRRRRPTRPSH